MRFKFCMLSVVSSSDHRQVHHYLGDDPSRQVSQRLCPDATTVHSPGVDELPECDNPFPLDQTANLLQVEEEGQGHHFSVDECTIVEGRGIEAWIEGRVYRGLVVVLVPKCGWIDMDGLRAHVVFQLRV